MKALRNQQILQNGDFNCNTNSHEAATCSCFCLLSILVKVRTIYIQMIHHIKSESTDEGKVTELNGI